jgi:hypothetical protein
MDSLRTDKRIMGRWFDIGIRRTFEFTRNYRPAPWNIIYLIYLHLLAKEPAHLIDKNILEEAVWTLETWPIDQVNWPVDNSKRLDKWIYPMTDYSGEIVMTKLVPYDENGSSSLSVLLSFEQYFCISRYCIHVCRHFSVFKWNRDPYRTHFDGDGMREYDPSAFLLPYYMAVFHDLI